MTQPSPIQQRLAELASKREEYGVSIARLSRRAGYSSSQTWHDLLKGNRPEATLVRFEQALDWLLENADDQLAEADGMAAAQAPAPESLIEFEVTGDFGVRVVVRGPVGNAEELERAAAQIIRDIRGQGASEA